MPSSSSLWLFFSHIGRGVAEGFCSGARVQQRPSCMSGGDGAAGRPPPGLLPTSQLPDPQVQQKQESRTNPRAIMGREGEGGGGNAEVHINKQDLSPTGKTRARRNKRPAWDTEKTAERRRSWTMLHVRATRREEKAKIPTAWKPPGERLHLSELPLNSRTSVDTFSSLGTHVRRRAQTGSK